MNTNREKYSESTKPQRSRLYSLTPLGEGTAAVESLTSYVNRLAWTYRVSPRLLVMQEIVPFLTGSHHLRSSKHNQSGSFCRRPAMSLNGAGEIAEDWTATLMRLTMRKDLRNLTLLSWEGGLSTHGLLRMRPVWCPTCYHEWEEKGYPIYQPLLWMLQTLTICPQHKQPLEERCSYCLKPQSAVAVKTRPGFCTQCKRWLGISPHTTVKPKIDEGVFDQQQWMIHVIEELYQTETTWNLLSLERFQTVLNVCMEAMGGMARFAQVVNMSDATLYKWRNRTLKPSLKSLLAFCYRLDISPLQLITEDPAVIKEMMRKRSRHPQPKLRQPHSLDQIDRGQILAFIQSILEGQEALRSIRDIERHFDLTRNTLVRWFPQECALINTQYQAYRTECKKQRMARMSEEVRQLTLTFYEQGKYPGGRAFAKMLSDPHMFRRPELLTLWHTLRRELGIES